MTSSEPLSTRVYRSAVNMWESTPGVAKPSPEEYAHLDVTAAPPPAAPPTPPGAPSPDQSARVASILERMQAQVRNPLANPTSGDAA